ncbi:DUF4226 domain-containing protein [Nocardia australiensis]|uniref:DUF4226 domain-containing protein n=1 Tax=Nocardia australiensis TaxID=2887191 RepID=UPI001D138806|nr:DUF4226 domain-containing protein [Nocardia australiensis]
MTSTEMWPPESDVEVDGPAEGGDTPGSATPWSSNPEHQRGRPRSVQPGQPADPAAPTQQPGVTAPSQNVTGAPGKGNQPGAAPNTATPPAGAAPGQQAPPATAPPSPPTSPAPPANAPAPAPPPPAPEPPAPLIDPDKITQLLPAAAMAGTMAVSALPMIASALAGLAGQGGGGGATPETDASPASGLTPEALRALQALKTLAEVYGGGDTTDPEVKAMRDELGVTPGSGSTATAIKARRLFQRNAATAFNTLDNQLANYTTRLAGNHKVDKKAISALLREVNVALAELGPQAYTKQGQYKVHQILTAALQKAHAIASAGQANSTDTAAAINGLTNQYLYNIAGVEVSGSSGSATPNSAAGRAIAAAVAQTGKPYVWGGEGPNGFDCSGLMRHAARAVGVTIPRTSQEQYAQLPKVNPADIQPGDLIFPASSFDSSGKPTHVVMYMGNGVCIAASRTGVPIGQVPLPSNFRASRWT